MADEVMETDLSRAQLTDSMRVLLLDAPKSVGSYNKEEVMPLIEERLTLEEYRVTEAFLDWVVDNGKTFGWNIDEVFGEFLHKHIGDKPMDQRIYEATEQAVLRFWETITQQFPEIKTGDLDPASSIAFTQCSLKTVEAWVTANKPS